MIVGNEMLTRVEERSLLRIIVISSSKSLPMQFRMSSGEYKFNLFPR